MWRWWCAHHARRPVQLAIGPASDPLVLAARTTRWRQWIAMTVAIISLLLLVILFLL
jgi:hypothetical protein